MTTRQFMVVLGLGTRPAALVCSGSMAYAYFTIHQEKAALPIQNGGEAAVMFCWAFLLIALAGPGAWAVETLLTRSGPGTGAREPADQVADGVAA